MDRIARIITPDDVRKYGDRNHCIGNDLDIARQALEEDGFTVDKLIDYLLFFARKGQNGTVYKAEFWTNSGVIPIERDHFAGLIFDTANLFFQYTVKSNGPYTVITQPDFASVAEYMAKDLRCRVERVQ